MTNIDPLEALRIGRHAAAQVLSDCKAAYAGYPQKWQAEQEDWDKIDAAIAAIEHAQREVQSAMTFAQRCRIAQECLPDAEYRRMLTALHDDMLAVAPQEAAGKMVATVKQDLMVAAVADVILVSGRVAQCTERAGHGMPDGIHPLYAAPMPQARLLLTGAQINAIINGLNAKHGHRWNAADYEAAINAAIAQEQEARNDR